MLYYKTAISSASKAHDAFNKRKKRQSSASTLDNNSVTSRHTHILKRSCSCRSNCYAPRPQISLERTPPTIVRQQSSAMSSTANVAFRQMHSLDATEHRNCRSASDAGRGGTQVCVCFFVN
jgi:hypothetical protein